MANLGLTVGQLALACQLQINKGNGDKYVLISDDDEGNGYHTLFYEFLTDKDEIEACLELEHDGTHTVDNCVILG